MKTCQKMSDGYEQGRNIIVLHYWFVIDVEDGSIVELW